MKNPISKIIILILCTTFSLSSMDSLGSLIRELKREHQQIDECLAKIPLDVAPESVVKCAKFDPNNTFEIGEIVIVQEIPTTVYLYGYVTKISPSFFSSAGHKFDVVIKRKKDRTDEHCFCKYVGKLVSFPSLLNLSINFIAHQLRMGTLNIDTIVPSQLPQELYDQVVKALHKK